jgi:methionyl aminopeptidase
VLTTCKTVSEIKAMREGGRMLASILQLLQASLQPGMSTKELANIAARELKRLGGEPTQLGFQGFPDVLCVSVNDEVVHGIPRANKIIKDGDIAFHGMVTDSAISCIAGTPLAGDQEFLNITASSLQAGILALHDGVWTGDIGAAIGKVLAEHNYGIVRDLVGHGVGHHLHEAPDVPNYGRKGTGTRLQTGMTIAIEPMATLGDYDVYAADDGWTILTADHSRSAHFEHTVLITEDGAEVLTHV